MKSNFKNAVVGIYVVEAIYAGFVGFVDLQSDGGVGGVDYVAGALILLGAAWLLFENRAASVSISAIAIASAINVAAAASVLKNWSDDGSQGQAAFYVCVLVLLVVVAVWPLSQVLKRGERLDGERL